MRRKTKKNASAKRLKKMLEDSSLSLAFAGLFIAMLIGQIISGFKFYNDQQAEHAAHQVSLLQFISSGTFLDGAFSNWQAAILQLAILIICSAILFQRGAAHSRKPEHGKKKRENSEKHNWFYRNSLFLALLTLFLLCFILHLIFGAKAFNEEQTLQGRKVVSLLEFFCSAKFWFSIFQTWEAEFFAIFLFVVLSIFLRQENSAESKPLDAPDNKTGEPND